MEIILLQALGDTGVFEPEKVSELSQAAIDLAEATSNYGALKVIFGIFLVVVLLLVVLFIYQTISNQRDLRSVITTLKKIGDHFEEMDNRSLGKEEAKVIARASLNSLSSTVKYNIIRLRLENHIDDKKATTDKIRGICNNMYNDLQNFLSRFLVNDSVVSTAIDYSEDNKLIQQVMISHIYLPENRFTISLMDEAVNILIEGFKNEASRLIDKF